MGADIKMAFGDLDLPQKDRAKSKCAQRRKLTMTLLLMHHDAQGVQINIVVSFEQEDNNRFDHHIKC